MKLYFNGCSHTVGLCSDLHNIEQTYAYKLSKKLNAEFINSALPKSSNDRILRTTIEDICSLDKLPDIAIIQWTYYDRFESPVICDDFDWARNKWKNYRLRDKEWKQYGPVVDIMKENANDFLKQYVGNNKLNAIQSFLTKVIALDSFLTNKNIRPIHMFFPSTKIIKDEKFKTLLNNCNTKNFINNPLTGIEAYLNDMEFKRATDLHFLEDAHDQIVEWLKNFINFYKPIEYKQREKMIDNSDMLFIYPG